jgi:hypothetical protein
MTVSAGIYFVTMTTRPLPAIWMAAAVRCFETRKSLSQLQPSYSNKGSQISVISTNAKHYLRQPEARALNARKLRIEVDMQPSLPVSDFIDPPRGTRPHNALCNAEKYGTQVWFIGEFQDERYFRAQTPKHERHVVVLWIVELSGELEVNCDCPAHRLRTGPDPCVHVGAVVKLTTELSKAGVELSTIQGMTIGELQPCKAN